jgi:hypothetical protein
VEIFFWFPFGYIYTKYFLPWTNGTWELSLKGCVNWKKKNVFFSCFLIDDMIILSTSPWQPCRCILPFNLALYFKFCSGWNMFLEPLYIFSCSILRVIWKGFNEFFLKIYCAFSRWYQIWFHFSNWKFAPIGYKVIVILDS